MWKGIELRFHERWLFEWEIMEETSFSSSPCGIGPISCVRKGLLLIQLSNHSLVSLPFLMRWEVFNLKKSLSLKMLLKEKDEFEPRVGEFKFLYLLVRKVT